MTMTTDDMAKVLLESGWTCIPPSEPMRTLERHATFSQNVRVYGDNLASEAENMGAGVEDARRLMLCAWESWISGEPPDTEIIHQMLATWWAMAAMTHIDDFGDVMRDIVDEVRRGNQP